MKNKPWVVNQKWTIAFFISHVLGWGIAWVQTFWIIKEIKNLKKRNYL